MPDACCRAFECRSGRRSKRVAFRLKVVFGRRLVSIVETPLGAPRTTRRCIVFCSAAVRLVDNARRLDLDALASAWICCVVSRFAALRALSGSRAVVDSH